MQTIHKYKLEPRSTISMPKCAKILHVAAQNDTVCLWAFVDTRQPTEERVFRVVGTGHDAEGLDPHYHLGTALLEDGALVLHVFEIPYRDLPASTR